MKIALHTSSDCFEELKEEWNPLLRKSTSNLIFLSWEWQHTWWKSYEAGDLWIVTLRNDDDTLIAIAPWFIQTYDSKRVLRIVGCVDVTDYVDIIAAPEHLTEVYDTLAQFLLEHNNEFDRINLCNIQEKSPSCTEFLNALKTRGFDAKLEFQEVCPIITLPATFEDYLNQLDKKQRHEIRRKIRKAENETDLTWYFVGEEHNFEDEINTFFHLMATSQPSKAEFLQDEKNAHFFRSILYVMRDAGWLNLSILKMNGIPVAAYCNFDYDNHIQVYNSGLDINQFNTLSSGIVLLSFLIEDAIKKQRSIFDFLRGNETYKYRMGAKDTVVYMLKAKVEQPVSV